MARDDAADPKADEQPAGVLEQAIRDHLTMLGRRGADGDVERRREPITDRPPRPDAPPPRRPPRARARPAAPRIDVRPRVAASSRPTARQIATRRFAAIAALVGGVALVVAAVATSAPVTTARHAKGAAARRAAPAAGGSRAGGHGVAAAPGNGGHIPVRTWATAGDPATFPFPPSPQERYTDARDALPAYWADGRACAVGCRAPGGIPGWPMKPFHGQHAIRSGFNEIRPSGFHVGIDIQAADGTPVYAVQPGRANVLETRGVDARVQVGNFVYWHVHPTVVQGQAVVAYRTIIGQVIAHAGHLHLSELGPGREYLNPLRPDGRTLEPYADGVPPVLGPARIASDGTALIQAYDPQSFHVTTTYETPVLGPAALAYAVSDRHGRRVSPLAFAFRGSHLIPHYAVGLVYPPYVHEPGWTCFATRRICRAHWDYRLAGGVAPSLAALGLPPGRYRLTAYAWDWAGNTAARETPFRVTAARGFAA